MVIFMSDFSRIKYLLLSRLDRKIIDFINYWFTINESISIIQIIKGQHA